MKTNIQTKRKFLIEIPLSWYGKFKVFKATRQRIYKTFLKKINKNIYSIELIHDPLIQEVKYVYKTETEISSGLAEERDCQIYLNEYKNYLSQEDKEKFRITKTTYNIFFYAKTFELDVYEDNLLGLSILKINSVSPDSQIILPPHFSIIREITGFNTFTDYKLADISSNKETKRFIESAVIK